MKRIAFDVMGTDNGPKDAIEAAIAFIKDNLDYVFILVGDQNEINKYVKGDERIQILDVKGVVSSTAKALDARNDETSMSVAIKLVADGKADGVISAGNSATYITLTTLLLKRIDGIKRPAFMPIFPTTQKDKKFLMLDVGANVQCTGEMLVQWAKMGDVFSRVVLGVDNPKVGILNIGTEETKGFDYHKEANDELKKVKEMNYIGFIEPRELMEGTTDVVVADGYAGNITLKTLEGVSKSINMLLKKSIKSKLRYKIGGLISKGAFQIVKTRLDHRNVGGAWVLGLNGLAIKAHGNSDMKAYIGAINQLRDAIEKDALVKFKEAL